MLFRYQICIVVLSTIFIEKCQHLHCNEGEGQTCGQFSADGALRDN